MKAHEMREMTETELQGQYEQFVEEIVNLRIKLTLKQIDDPVKVRHLRKDIARAKTVLREKSEGAAPGQKPGAAAGE